MAKTDISEALLRAAVELMRPLVRRLLAQGVPFGTLERRLRELYVQVADAEFRLEDRPQTDSRVSVLTGINRKEVHRIRKADPVERGPSSFQRNFAASLVTRWMTDPRTSDRGRPRPLPYIADEGPSFVELARETTVDLRPRALLDTLLGSGAATIDERDVVTLTKEAYTPARGRPEALAMLAEDPPELLETMLYNVLGEGEGTRLQQKVAYDNLGADGLARLRRTLVREAKRFLKSSNAALARHDRDRNPDAPGGERTYAGVGVYYFETPGSAERAHARAGEPRGGKRRKGPAGRSGTKRSGTKRNS